MNKKRMKAVVMRRRRSSIQGRNLGQEQESRTDGIGWMIIDEEVFLVRPADH